MADTRPKYRVTGAYVTLKTATQAVQWVVSECGQLPVDLPPTDELMVSARTAAEWRAAADIEVAYPLNRDPDVRLFQVLDQRAKDALATVKLAMQGEGVGQVDLV